MLNKMLNSELNNLIYTAQSNLCIRLYFRKYLISSVVKSLWDVSDTHMYFHTYLLVCVFAHIMHAFLCLPLHGSLLLSPRLRTRWIQLPLVEPQKPRDSANEPAHICSQTICNIFYSGVCSDSTTVFAGKSASTCVREQAQACARHLISVPVNWCVSCTEKDKNNLKEHKSGVSLPRRTKVTRWTRWLTETWHMHLTMTTHLDICIVCLWDHLYCQTALQEQKTCWELSNICQRMFGCSQVCFTKEKCLQKQSD